MFKMGQAILPAYIAHGNARKGLERTSSINFILLVKKLHYYRGMFCKKERYFVTFIHDDM